MYLNEIPIKHGIAVMTQSKSVCKLKEVLQMMEQEPIAFGEYIPEIEHLISELSQEDYHTNSKTWR